MHPRITNMHAAACDASEHIFESARALAFVNEYAGSAAVPALYNAFAERQHAYFIPPLLQTLGGDRCSDYCTRHLLPALKKITTTLTAPLRACVWSDLKDPRGGADAQAFGQARQHAHDEFHGDLLAMENRAVMLREIPLACGALELTPGTAIGMTVGAQIAPPAPAAIPTARVGTEVLGGVHHAGTAVGWGHRLGWHRRRRSGMRSFALTEGTMGLSG